MGPKHPNCGDALTNLGALAKHPNCGDSPGPLKLRGLVKARLVHWHNRSPIHKGLETRGSVILMMQYLQIGPIHNANCIGLASKLLNLGKCS